MEILEGMADEQLTDDSEEEDILESDTMEVFEGTTETVEMDIEDDAIIPQVDGTNDRQRLKQVGQRQLSRKLFTDSITRLWSPEPRFIIPKNF